MKREEGGGRKEEGRRRRRKRRRTRRGRGREEVGGKEEEEGGGREGGRKGGNEDGDDDDDVHTCDHSLRCAMGVLLLRLPEAWSEAVMHHAKSIVKPGRCGRGSQNMLGLYRSLSGLFTRAAANGLVRSRYESCKKHCKTWKMLDIHAKSIVKPGRCWETTPEDVEFA